jgi:hypothetical protein
VNKAVTFSEKCHKITRARGLEEAAGAQCPSHMQKYETDACDEHHIILQFWPLDANLHGRNTQSLYISADRCFAVKSESLPPPFLAEKEKLQFFSFISVCV